MMRVQRLKSTMTWQQNLECEGLSNNASAYELLSCEGTLKHYISAYTTHKITGNMRPIEWRVNAKEWPHLRKVKFPKLGP